MDPTRGLAERIRAGRSSVVVGDLPDLPAGTVALRVVCDRLDAKGVLERARATLEAALDHGGPPRIPSRHRHELAVHRRLLAGGEVWSRPETAFVEAGNRLAAFGSGRIVLVLDGVDEADDASLRALATIFRDRDRLRLPLVLLTRHEPRGALLEVVDSLVDRASAAVTDRRSPASPSGSTSTPSPAPTPLPEELLRALRAAADPLRAAASLDAIGRAVEAIEHRIDAAARMIDAGEVERARFVLDEMRAKVAAVTSSTTRAVLKARLRLERARIMWLTTGEKGASTLAEAWTEALGAWNELPDGPCAAAARAYAAATLAAIAYDRGDGAALDRTREILVDTIGDLLQHGAALDAASLLNEHAALELQRGRVSAAAHLLEQSRALFEARIAEAPGESASRAELADTELLLARLPLHASPSSSDEVSFLSRESLDLALDRAWSAERAYRALHLRRDVARACDVIGQLELRRGERDRARVVLEEALGIAQEVGDAAALARATAALAEIFAAAGHPEQALGVLRSSISVNREKGSSLGLSFDAAALEIIEHAVSRMGGAVEIALRAELARARDGLDDGNGPVTARV